MPETAQHVAQKDNCKAFEERKKPKKEEKDCKKTNYAWLNVRRLWLGICAVFNLSFYALHLTATCP